MLTRVAEGVFVHESEFLQSNAIVIDGTSGALLIDPGITRGEMTALGDELRTAGRPVVAGFSTHPHWDHVLWHAAFGDAPRYATAVGASSIREVLENPDWREQVADALPPEHADDIPMELLGLLTGLPAGADRVPWDGPSARIIEHRGHTPGHAALLIEDRGVLAAGDMLSDTLMPFLDLQAADPIGDYLAALAMFDEIADDVEVVVPGHGSVGGPGDARARIALDRAYVQALRAGEEPDDPRIGPSSPLEWLRDVHDWQRQRIAEKYPDERTS